MARISEHRTNLSDEALEGLERALAKAYEELSNGSIWNRGPLHVKTTSGKYRQWQPTSSDEVRAYRIRRVLKEIADLADDHREVRRVVYGLKEDVA